MNFGLPRCQLAKLEYLVTELISNHYPSVQEFYPCPEHKCPTQYFDRSQTPRQKLHPYSADIPVLSAIISVEISIRKISQSRIPPFVFTVLQSLAHCQQYFFDYMIVSQTISICTSSGTVPHVALFFLSHSLTYPVVGSELSARVSAKIGH